MPADRVSYESLSRLGSRFSVWVLRLDVRRTRSTAAQFSSADRLMPGSLSRHMLVMPVARMPRDARIPPQTSGHFVRYCQSMLVSGKTHGNSAHWIMYRNTYDFPVPGEASRIGRNSASARKIEISDCCKTWRLYSYSKDQFLPSKRNGRSAIWP
jgi:hypothetical protein